MSDMKKIIRFYLNESYNKNEIWYHGTPDVRQLEIDGGFTHKQINVEYVDDVDGYNNHQDMLSNLRTSDEVEYFKELDNVNSYKKSFTYRKPVFLTNDYNVAKTYADPNRSFNYQDSVEKVLKVEVTYGKNVSISAYGDRFRFIELNKVRDGFIKGGVKPEDFDKAVNMLNFYLKDKTRIKTDMIGALGEWFDFDIIDVLGVLDSYQGGNIKSTVRMVFDPKKIKIIK